MVEKEGATSTSIEFEAVVTVGTIGVGVILKAGRAGGAVVVVSAVFIMKGLNVGAGKFVFVCYAGGTVVEEETTKGLFGAAVLKMKGLEEEEAEFERKGFTLG